MQKSRLYNKADYRYLPSWLDSTVEAILMCHYCDASSKSVDDFSNPVSSLNTTTSNKQKSAVPEEQQKSCLNVPFAATFASPYWLCMSCNDNSFLSSLLHMSQNLSNHPQHDNFIESQYGVLLRNLQEDYELYRV
jgi:hypothetical protein